MLQSLFIANFHEFQMQSEYSFGMKKEASEWIARCVQVRTSSQCAIQVWAPCIKNSWKIDDDVKIVKKIDDDATLSSGEPEERVARKLGKKIAGSNQQAGA